MCIDHRYVCVYICNTCVAAIGQLCSLQAQFYVSHHYQRYNMFNHFFYSPGGLEACEQFLEGPPSSLAIVLDPPFGGLVELLAVSIRKFWEIVGQGRIGK